MISTENIANKIQMLPPASQKEVLDLIDELLERRARMSPEEKIAIWKQFGSSNHGNTAIVVDDSREGIYED
jgi:hypothetical protein